MQIFIYSYYSPTPAISPSVLFCSVLFHVLGGVAFLFVVGGGVYMWSQARSFIFHKQLYKMCIMILTHIFRRIHFMIFGKHKEVLNTSTISHPWDVFNLTDRRM